MHVHAGAADPCDSLGLGQQDTKRGRHLARRLTPCKPPCASSIGSTFMLSSADPIAGEHGETPMTTNTERAVLAGGCFWGMQDLIRRKPGVISTRVGYSGGDVKNATYRNHGTHAEAIEIIFDPRILSFRDILEFFFQIHDPTTRNRQGNDLGTSYRSAIFYTSP